MLAVGSKPGGPFKGVDKGTYTLADASPPPTNGANIRMRAVTPSKQKRAAKPRTPKRQPAKRTS